jgi:flagellar biosynthesis protein FliP
VDGAAMIAPIIAATTAPTGINGITGGSSAVQILVLVGGISLIPALLFCVTGFTRILIVLGFIRTAIGTQSAPPNQVLVGIALFLTLFVMAPTFNQIKKDAWDPLQANKIHFDTAVKRAEEPLRAFMFHQTRQKDLSLFVRLSRTRLQPRTRADIPTTVLVPAFIVSELKTAFQIGFLIFLPFLVIDLIVSSTLMSMGMVMLPPTFISLPFKILLFVLVDGWDLVTQSLVQSFH